MKTYVNFGIELPIQNVKHIPEKSFYDHNYYQLIDLGDWFYGELNIVFQHYDECCNCYTYSLGKMIDGEFKELLCWTLQEDIFEDIK